MAAKLPGWVQDDRASIAWEVAPYRDITWDERVRLMHEVGRTAMAFLMARDDWREAVAYRDPLPESSVRILERLRRQYAGSPRH